MVQTEIKNQKKMSEEQNEKSSINRDATEKSMQNKGQLRETVLSHFAHIFLKKSRNLFP